MLRNILTDQAFTVIMGSKHYTILIDDLPENVEINDLLYAAERDDEQYILNVVDKIKSVLNYAEGKVEIIDGVLHFKGKELYGYLADKIVDMHDMGAPIKGYVSFLKRLMVNPSMHNREHLYKFLEFGNMPIDGDGYFYAYKYVTDDYKDVHTRSINNRIGTIVTMDRADVNDDPEHGCSTGLHVGTLQYIKSCGSGRKAVIVKVNPRDVVAVPYDCEHQKVRCCKYQVIEDFKGDAMQDVYIDSMGGEVEEITYTNDEVLNGSL